MFLCKFLSGKAFRGLVPGVGAGVGDRPALTLPASTGRIGDPNPRLLRRQPPWAQPLCMRFAAPAAKPSQIG